MKSLIIAFVAALSLGEASAYSFDPEAYEPVKKATKEEQEKMTPAQKEEYLAGRKIYNLHRHGGIMWLNGSGKLLVAVVNGAATSNQLSRCLGQVHESLRIEVEEASLNVSGFGIDKIPSIKKEHNAQLAVFVVDDPKLPASLHAAEEGWTLVNVAKMRAGNPDAEKLDLRIRKLIARGFMAAIGGTADTDDSSPMKPAPTVEALDKIPVAHISFWNIGGMTAYLKGMGVVPPTLTTYRRAVRAGYAPAPTNKWQKLIWESEHQVPSNPMKIKFDPKTDK